MAARVPRVIVSFCKQMVNGRTARFLPALLAIVLLLAIPLGIASTAPRTQTIPTFSIVSVDADNSVTVRTANLPANQEFRVTMGPMGTLGIGGTEVARTASGAGGTLEATYQIPANLKGARQIAIRMESSQGYYAYNWFYNNTTGTTNGSGTGDGGTGGALPPPVATIPTFTVLGVQEGQSVTIRTSNFPANRDFVVTMGPMGTRGIDGYVAETINSGEGGTFERTFNIPTEMRAANRIAIRLQATTGGYHAYNWFYNDTSGTPGSGDGAMPTPTPAPGTGDDSSYSGFPWFTIVSVQRDQSVTVNAHNLPANHDFVVTMSQMGTRGLGGTAVATTATGSGGDLTATYQIPDNLKGAYQIAIRMESADGYFAYNWFYNATSP